MASNYIFPLNGGLKLAYGDKTIGIFMNGTPVGDILIAAYLDPIQGWLAFWTSGPFLQEELEAQITAAGGIVNWLKNLVSKIMDAIKKIFGITGSTPTPTPQIDLNKYSIDNVNIALKTYFTLSAGDQYPIFAPK